LDVRGQPRFPGAREWVAHSASGNLRLGHRAPGRGGRRASIPFHALTTLSALGAFCLLEPRGARTCPVNVRYMCSDNENASQGADNISVRAGGVLSVRTPRFSTNLNILRSICSGQGDPARREATTEAPNGSPRSYPRPTPPVASEDEASACPISARRQGT